MTNQAQAASHFDQALARCGNCPVEVILWSRGGPPGPGYTSDQLTLSRRDGLLSATYVTARFDRAYEKNFRALRYRAGLPASALDEMLSALRTDSLFDTVLKSESRGNLADGLKDSYTVTINAERFEKTLVQSTPEEVSRVKAVRNRLVAHLLKATDVSDLNAPLAH